MVTYGNDWKRKERKKGRQPTRKRRLVVEVRASE